MSEPLAVLDGLWLGYDIADQNEADRAAEACTQRLAFTTVLRSTANHPCTGAGCLHRNHRRDMAHLEFLREMLDLPPVTARPADYASPLAWGSFTRDDVKLLH